MPDASKLAQRRRRARRRSDQARAKWERMTPEEQRAYVVVHPPVARAVQDGTLTLKDPQEDPTDGNDTQ